MQSFATGWRLWDGNVEYWKERGEARTALIFQVPIPKIPGSSFPREHSEQAALSAPTSLISPYEHELGTAFPKSIPLQTATNPVPHILQSDPWRSFWLRWAEPRSPGTPQRKRRRAGIRKVPASASPSRAMQMETAPGNRNRIPTKMLGLAVVLGTRQFLEKQGMFLSRKLKINFKETWIKQPLVFPASHRKEYGLSME